MHKPPSHLRVIFMGTPEFALPSLRALAGAAQIVAVVTQPDRPAGRGRRVSPPPVAVYAREDGLPVMQPPSLRRPEVVRALAELHPDLLVTVAYGRIIPDDVLALPPRGAINAHPSLLPAYRGASPIQRAIADGQTETGVSIIYQTAELDAGDIILQERVAIGPEETAGELERRLADLAAPLLLAAVRLIAEGRAPRRPQEHAAATYVGKLTKEDGQIHWDRPAETIANLVRAMDPWPSAYTFRAGRQVKIWRARAEPDAAVTAGGPAEPGTVLAVTEDGTLLATGRGLLRALEVQPADGKRMSAAAFARGHRVQPGERWGAPGPADDSGTLSGGGER